MPPSNTYSTAAVNGSADEFAYSSPAPKTAAQVEANKALAAQRIETFVEDASPSARAPVSIPGYLEIISTDASRCLAASANIAAFESKFNGTASNPNN